MKAAYLAPAEPWRGELEIQRSRFLTYLEPVRSEQEARDGVARVRGEHPQARHHCTAFVIGPDARLRRSNDDGEPSGTAGAPMLEALLGAGLSDALAVVVRYFGGVLLGTGGLTRAYRSAVADTVATAPLVRRTLRSVLGVELDYAQAHAVTGEAERAGWSCEATYGAGVTLELGVPPREADAARERLAGLTGGVAEVRDLGERWVDLSA